MDGLEFDIWFTSLRLDAEYQGEQHTKELKGLFHRKEGAFEAQLERDARKRRLCAENGVTLFEIPHQYNCSNPKKMEEFIRNWLEDHGYLKRTQTKLFPKQPAIKFKTSAQKDSES